MPRNELLLKLFFGAQVSAEVNQKHVMSFMQRHQAAIGLYGAMAKQLKKEEANDPQLPYWLMTLNFGRHNSLAMVRWGRETLAELKELEGGKKGGKNART